MLLLRKCCPSSIYNVKLINDAVVLDVTPLVLVELWQAIQNRKMGQHYTLLFCSLEKMCGGLVSLRYAFETYISYFLYCFVGLFLMSKRMSAEQKFSSHFQTEKFGGLLTMVMTT